MGSDIIVNVAREETRVAVLDRKILSDLIGAPEMGEPLLELDDKTTEVAKAHRHSSKPIEDLLEEGQELMVQVTKGPIGTKGSRVTAYISLPGRYLVFMPNVDHIGISRRIEKDEERARLKQLMQKLRKPGQGYIVRTVSEGVSDEELRSDVEFLQASWEEILDKKKRLKAPALLHSDLDLVFRTVRDHFTKDVQHLWIDSKVEYEAIREFVSRYLPEFLSRIHLYMREE